MKARFARRVRVMFCASALITAGAMPGFAQKTQSAPPTAMPTAAHSIDSIHSLDDFTGNEDLVDFEAFPSGTLISDQYSGNGAIFVSVPSE